MSQPLPPSTGDVSGLYDGLHLRASARPGQAPAWSASQDGQTWHNVSRSPDGTCELYLVADGRIVQGLRQTVGLQVRRVLVPAVPLDLMLQRAEALGAAFPGESRRLHQG